MAKKKWSWYLIWVIVASVLFLWLSYYFLFYNVNNNWMNNTCEAVTNYITNSNSKGEWDYTIAKWDTIVVDYIGTLDDGMVFDTSVETVAQECGKYTPGRDYDSGLEFEVWAWQMIAGFDAGVEGMKLSQTKTITIPAKEAYGEVDQQMIIPMPKDKVQNPEQYKEWLTMQTPRWYEGVVTEVTDTSIIVDMNHPLAGKDLHFTITIKEIK